MRVARVPTVLAALAVALAAGCGGGDGDDGESESAATTTTPAAGTTVLTATLTAAAANPKGPEGARGTASITLDPGNSRACWRFTVQGVDKPLSAHVHLGANGDVAIPLGDTFARRGCVLTGQRVLDEVADSPGDYYVDVHTEKHLQGAVRGRLRAAAG